MAQYIAVAHVERNAVNSDEHIKRIERVYSFAPFALYSVVNARDVKPDALCRAEFVKRAAITEPPVAEQKFISVFNCFFGVEADFLQGFHI